MHLFLIFVLCTGLFATCAQADEDNEVKRGVFPYMAFVYYSDKTIVDRTGTRLVRGAILIRPEWLISSSLEDEETALAFPKETLVARLGAIRIDSGFIINEDEEEQEREIVQIARPYNYSATKWWVEDISLLKALLPFNITAAVAPVAIDENPQATYKDCFMLIYSAPNGNRSEEKMLMQHSVDVLPSTPESCGSNYVKRTMICATDGDDFKKEPNFCESNSGSPLVCDREVVGIHTYVNDCKPPHLYQLLSSWENLITCAIEDKCKEEQCGTICNVINKDSVDVSPQRTLLAEAKVYPEENINHSNNEANLNTTMLRWLSPDGSKTLPDKDSKDDVNNTETTTTTFSTVVYVTEKEIDVSSETEMATPTVTGRTEEEVEVTTATLSTLSTYYNTEAETTQYIYKTEELMNKVEELKSFIDENMNSDGSQVKEEHKVRSAAAMITQSPFCLMSYLILFYLLFSFIVNSF